MQKVFGIMGSLCYFLLAGLVMAMAMAMVCGATYVDVVDYGAVGDGQRDNKNAFLKAWARACNQDGSPTLLVPGGNKFLLSMIQLKGPCKSPLKIQIDGTLLAPNSLWTNIFAMWITVSTVDNLILTGSGKIDGRGSIWWECKHKNECTTNLPYEMHLTFCKNVRISGLTFLNSPAKHLTVHECTGVTIARVTVTSSEDSPNTDGIFIQNSKNITVKDSIIRTGDDCIAIGSQSSHIAISGIKCGPGHGISIGSLGKENSYNTVENIHVSDCLFTGTSNGARIKTWQGGSGYARNIVYKNLQFHGVKNPVIIDQYYCDEGYHCFNSTSAVEVSNVEIVNAKGTSSNKVAIKLACSLSVPCTGILLHDVDIKYGQGHASSYCLSAKGQSVGLVVPQVPCLSDST